MSSDNRVGKKWCSFGRMDEVSKLFGRVRDGRIDDVLRADIAKLLVELLESPLGFAPRTFAHAERAVELFLADELLLCLGRIRLVTVARTLYENPHSSRYEQPHIFDPNPLVARVKSWPFTRAPKTIGQKG